MSTAPAGLPFAYGVSEFTTAPWSFAHLRTPVTAGAVLGLADQDVDVAP